MLLVVVVGVSLMGHSCYSLSGVVGMGQWVDHRQDFSDDHRPITRHSTGEGTTLDIKQIVIGRCWAYQRDVIGFQGAPPPSLVDCETVVWPTFVRVFAHKEPCNVPRDAYRNFTRMMTVSLPEHGTIIWSGAMGVAMAHSKLSGGAAFSLETSFLGYTLSNLVWCGTSSGANEGINYDACPAITDQTCHSSGKGIFWEAASTEFAKQARGWVTVFLNGSDDRGAFRNTSFLSQTELPNLNVSRVPGVHIIVLHDLSGKTVDTCDSGSILILKDRLSKKRLEWTCEDDPRSVTLILCTENPDSARCHLMRSGADRATGSSVGPIVSIALALYWFARTQETY